MRIIGRIMLGLTLALANAAWSASSQTYFGLEYFGSSSFSRQELEQLAGLKGDASIARVMTAQTRLKKHFEREGVKANIEVVAVGPDRVALVIDLPDSLSSVVTRRLISPHVVRLTSEKPFRLLNDLQDRLARIAEAGRPAQEEWRQTFKFYSDEPANQMIKEIQKFLPGMQDELLAVVDSDPDPLKRAQAIELLGWAPETNDIAKSLLAALDDADGTVRSESVQYFYARLNVLNDAFPFDALIERLVHMLDRPTHPDRSNALHCMLKLCQLHNELVPLTKSLSERRIAQISRDTILPALKETADKLQALFNQAPGFAGAKNAPR